MNLQIARPLNMLQRLTSNIKNVKLGLTTKVVKITSFQLYHSNYASNYQHYGNCEITPRFYHYKTIAIVTWFRFNHCMCIHRCEAVRSLYYIKNEKCDDLHIASFRCTEN